MLNQQSLPVDSWTLLNDKVWKWTSDLFSPTKFDSASPNSINKIMDLAHKSFNISHLRCTNKQHASELWQQSKLDSTPPCHANYPSLTVPIWTWPSSKVELLIWSLSIDKFWKGIAESYPWCIWRYLKWMIWISKQVYVIFTERNLKKRWGNAQ